MTDYFVRTINYLPHKPTACMSCGTPNLIKNVVIAMTGTKPQTVSRNDSILCLDCETLMIITTKEKKAIQLGVTNPQDTVTLRDSGKQ